MRELTSADLRQYVMDRSRLPIDVVEYIAEERAKDGSAVQKWFQDSQRKLTASGADVDWWALFEETLREVEPESLPLSIQRPSEDNTAGLQKRLDAARTCRVPSWVSLPDALSWLGEWHFRVASLVGVTKFWRLSRDPNPLIWKVIFNRFAANNPMYDRILPLWPAHTPVVIERLDAGELRELTMNSIREHVAVGDLGAQLLFAMSETQSVGESLTSLAQSPQYVSKMFASLENSIREQRGSKPRSIARLLVDSVLTFPPSDFTDISFSQRNNPELAREADLRFSSADREGRGRLLGVMSRCEISQHTLSIVRKAIAADDMTELLVRFLDSRNWHLRSRSALMCELAGESFFFADRTMRSEAMTEELRSMALRLAATINYAYLGHETEFAELIIWCVNNSVMAKHAAEVSVRFGDPRHLRALLASSVLNADEERRTACLKLLAKCDEVEAVRGYLHYIEDVKSCDSPRRIRVVVS